jgi:hypothetical protein
MSCPYCQHCTPFVLQPQSLFYADGFLGPLMNLTLGHAGIEAQRRSALDFATRARDDAFREAFRRAAQKEEETH